MNFYRFRSVCNGSFVNAFRSAHSLSKAEAAIELLPKQDAVVSQVSGINVASIENYSPLTQVSVIVKAGSRYEKPQNAGVVHALRNCAASSTKNNSTFIITRTLEELGAKLSATSTRENLIYSLECPRDNTDIGLEILADVVTNPAFKSHEVSRRSDSLHADLALLNTNPDAVLMEALHKAAFRGGLSNSLYTPSFMIGKHTSEMLHSFVDDYFTASRTSVIGLGVPHDNLKENVSKLFHLKDSSASSTASKFSAGEIRVTADIPCVHAAIVAEGASLSNTKEMLSLALLQCMLGHGSNVSPLGQAAAKCTSNPFYVSGLSLNYSDGGAFGVYIKGLPGDMQPLVKAVVSAMRELPKNLSDNAVEIAKHKLKAKLAIDRETSQDLLNAMAIEISTFGKVNDIKDILKAVDELKSSDVAAIASKVVKSKPAMAALGHLHSTPFIDELL